MSRSFKKHPFRAICGGASAKHDKRLAARGVRRAHKASIRTAEDFEDFILPHRHECQWNNTYCWGRDGSQMWQFPDARDWSRYLDSQRDECRWHGDHIGDCWHKRRMREDYGTWPPRWYVEMMRK